MTPLADPNRLGPVLPTFELQHLLGGKLMTCNIKIGSVLRAVCCVGIGAVVLTAPPVEAAVIVNDSWADGGRDNGPDPQDSNWWASSSPNGIEVSVGSLGMVTGTSGRGIHTIFPTQTLANVGDKLVATYTFTTPATVGSGGAAGFRAGLFDTLGRAGLDADITASSGSPNPVYGLFSTPTDALPGYMLDMDVGTGTEDLNFRQHDTVPTAMTPTGRLMGTTSGFTSISSSGPDGAYALAPNTTYTGSLTIMRTSATDMQLTGTLGTASHTVTDAFDSDDFGMLAFWANSNLFGTSATPGEANNGIDFSNVQVEFIPVPEPGTALLGTLAMMLWSAAVVVRPGRRARSRHGHEG
jgi:hypothetical protein